MRNAKPGAGIFAERNNPDPVVADYRHTLFRTWQERIRDPSLTVLLIFELSAFFLLPRWQPRDCRWRGWSGRETRRSNARP